MDEKSILTGAEILPANLRSEDMRALIPHSPKLQKMVEMANATLEGNVRLFLESECGITGARNLKTSIEDIRLRMEILNIKVVHVMVQKKPELDGIWIIKGDKPMVCFTDPRYVGKKLVIKKIILGSPGVIISPPGLKGSA